MNFKEQKTLLRCGPIDQQPDEAVNGTLLVAEEQLVSWEQDHSQYGYNRCSLRAAIQNGERGFLLRKVWQACGHYSAEGTSEHFLPLQQGLESLVRHGGFEKLYDLCYVCDSIQDTK